MTLRATDDERVRVLRLDRPERRNALDPQTLADLGHALRTAASDPSVRAVVLSATGPVFSAGGDVHIMREHAGDAQATLLRLRRGLNHVVRTLHAAPVPVVCAAAGDAYGAGAVLAFQCDLTVVSATARFAFSFRHVGLVPDTGGTWLLPRVLGAQRAKHLVWTGDPFSGAQAAEWGLALKACPQDAVEARAMELARGLAAGPARTTALSKAALEAGSQGTLDAALEREGRLQAQASLSPEHKEGRDAFFARRPPVWP